MDAQEIIKIKEIYEERRGVYEALSEYMLDRCLGIQREHPKVVRVVFSREPKVKTLESITRKIEEQRRTYNSHFQYEDLTDIVALTVLCPYASDTTEFVAWMKKAFSVQTRDDVAEKVYENGHRGWHYLAVPTDSELVSRPGLNGITCEIQVKTLLQEAFDAKSHDLAYKPGNLEVGEELKTQFALLSASLNAIDGQTEFLKDLILRDQRELDLRRKACLELYLGNSHTIPSQLGLDPQGLPDVVSVTQAFKAKASELLSVEFCKFAAYCALKLNHELLRSRALEYTTKFVAQEPNDFHRKFVRGSILWALSYFDPAFTDLAAVADNFAQHKDVALRSKAVNNFVYFVCDCKLFKCKINELWVSKASEYFAQLNREVGTNGVEDGRHSDTVGFYLIIFGKTAEEIDQGRQFLRQSKVVRKNDVRNDNFYQLHEYVALNRLLRLAKNAVFKRNH